MNNIDDANYYEVLSVPPSAPPGAIHAAYRFARTLYSGESGPTHGLLDADDRERMRSLVEQAYAALSNPKARREYDLRLGVHRDGRAPGAGADPVDSPRASLEEPPAERPGLAETETPRASTAPITVPEVVNGAVLKALRESRSLSIVDIAAISRVGSRFLKALEEDRHSILPGRVFARGFLIEYARAIGAPESEVVERYLKNWTAR